MRCSLFISFLSSPCLLDLAHLQTDPQGPPKVLEARGSSSGNTVLKQMTWNACERTQTTVCVPQDWDKPLLSVLPMPSPLPPGQTPILFFPQRSRKDGLRKLQETGVLSYRPRSFLGLFHPNASCKTPRGTPWDISVPVQCDSNVLGEKRGKLSITCL